MIQNVFGVVFALIFCSMFYWLMSKKGNSGNLEDIEESEGQLLTTSLKNVAFWSE